MKNTERPPHHNLGRLSFGRHRQTGCETGQITRKKLPSGPRRLGRPEPTAAPPPHPRPPTQSSTRQELSECATRYAGLARLTDRQNRWEVDQRPTQGRPGFCVLSRRACDTHPLVLQNLAFEPVHNLDARPIQIGPAWIPNFVSTAPNCPAAERDRTR